MKIEYTKKIVFSVLLLMLLMPLQANGDDFIEKGEYLSLERCIGFALRLHPSIIAAKGNVSISESRIGQAQSNYFPQIDASGGYSRIKPASTTSGAGISKSNSAYDQYTSSINLNQTLFDFGKTPTQVKIQKLNRDATNADFYDTIEQVIFNVKQAYYNALKAQRNKDTTNETVSQYKQHLEQARGFYETGIKPKFDVTKAEVDLSNAKLKLIKAGNAFKLAIVFLNNAIGIPDAPEYNLEDNLTVKRQMLKLEDALPAAFKNRRDLISILAKKEAAMESISLAKKGYYPVLNGSASYNWTSQKFPLQEGWNVGATLTFPIFSGYLTKYQVSEAEANLNVVRANEEALRQTIQLNLKQAYLQLLEAEESITTAELAVEQATENLEIANGRYEAGIGSPIEVTDAQVAYSDAKLSHTQALYDYQVVFAGLERALGGEVK